MRYVAAYMLAVLGGKDDPTADDIRPIIESVGIEVEEDRLNVLLEKLKGKNIENAQENGFGLLATVPGMTIMPDKRADTIPVVDEEEKNKDNKDSKVDEDDDEDSDDSFDISIFGYGDDDGDDGFDANIFG